jgi:hypothetical protein
VEWLSVTEANFLSFLSFLDRHVGTFCTNQSTNIFVMEFFVVQTYPIIVGSCFHTLSKESWIVFIKGSIPWNGNGVNCELGTGKFSQRKVMVNLQNIFVMDVFVVQTYPVTVGSCFHYPLQGIMDHFHQGFHSLEMVMELIVNWERASFHKGRRWSTCKTYLLWRSLWFKLTWSMLAVAFITLFKE